MTDNLNQVPNAFADIGTVAFACGATLLPIFYAAKRRLG
jgi:hypothetical protein